MAQNPFVGAWRLVSMETRSSDGEVTYPFGPHPIGYIMYTENGYMSVAFMKADRAGVAGGDILSGTVEEWAAAAKSYISYCGRYEIQGDKVIHHVEVSLFPNWVGVDQERFFRLDGDRLHLTTPPMLAGGTQQTSALIWERT